MAKTSKFLFALTLIALIAATGDARAQGSFVVDQVFSVDGDPERPASWAANGNVYDVQFAVRYRSDRCIGNYRVRFVFDRDVRVLRVGDTFRIGVRKIFGEPPCGHKWTYAWVSDAGQKMPDHPSVPAQYEYNENIEALEDGSVRMWETQTVEATSTLQVQLKKDAPYSHFTLNAGDNTLTFVYRYAPSGGVARSGDGWERGIDRMGQDFRRFDQSQPDPGICEAACANEPRCRAWTWVRPGHQGPLSRCWLKHSVPPARQADCCVSGVR